MFLVSWCTEMEGQMSWKQGTCDYWRYSYVQFLILYLKYQGTTCWYGMWSIDGDYEKPIGVIIRRNSICNRCLWSWEQFCSRKLRVWTQVQVSCVGWRWSAACSRFNYCFLKNVYEVRCLRIILFWHSVYHPGPNSKKACVAMPSSAIHFSRSCSHTRWEEELVPVSVDDVMIVVVVVTMTFYIESPICIRLLLVLCYDDVFLCNSPLRVLHIPPCFWSVFVCEGVGTYMLELLHDLYPEVYRFAVSVYPSEDNDVNTSPYNSILGAWVEKGTVCCIVVSCCVLSCLVLCVVKLTLINVGRHVWCSIVHEEV